MAYRSRGYVQTPGWNRLTQALVDHRTYITGRNTVLVDVDGNGRLTPNEIGTGRADPGLFRLQAPIDPRFVLNTGVGTTTLSPRTVFISNRDFSDTDTATAYFDLAKRVGPGRGQAAAVLRRPLEPALRLLRLPGGLPRPM